MKKCSWFIGGIIGLATYLGYRFLLIPLFQDIEFISGILDGLLLIVTIPLIVVFSYIGFGLDMFLNTDMGAQTLETLPWGNAFMLMFTGVYFFGIGALVGWLISRRRSS